MTIMSLAGLKRGFILNCTKDRLDKKKHSVIAKCFCSGLDMNEELFVGNFD